MGKKIGKLSKIKVTALSVVEADTTGVVLGIEKKAQLFLISSHHKFCLRRQTGFETS